MFFSVMNSYNLLALIYTRIHATQVFHYEWLISTKPSNQAMDYDYLLNIKDLFKPHKP